MKTRTIHINGQEYLLCLTTRVILDIQEKYGNYNDGLNSLMNSDKIDDLFWLLAELIKGGNRYAIANGLDNPGELPLDFLLDAICVADYPKMLQAITESVSAGTETRLETRADPNAETIPGEA